MDHLIDDDDDRLKSCPFCGGEAEFNRDENGWNWIECLACGASTNARVSAMDDAQLLLLEQWNKRVPPACGCREGECESKQVGFPGAQPAPSINEGVRKVTRGFRWESEAQHHIPTIEIEFDPVSPDSPNDAKGWQDRDRIASMLSPEAKP